MATVVCKPLLSFMKALDGNRSLSAHFDSWLSLYIQQEIVSGHVFFWLLHNFIQ